MLRAASAVPADLRPVCWMGQHLRKLPVGSHMVHMAMGIHHRQRPRPEFLHLAHQRSAAEAGVNQRRARFSPDQEHAHSPFFYRRNAVSHLHDPVGVHSISSSARWMLYFCALR